MNTGSLAVLLIFGTGFVAVAGNVIIKILKALREGPRPEDRKAMTEEIAIMQELSRELLRMQERIEALETILTDRDRQGGTK
jgi:phage shock protein B